ncbi:MAG: DUF721 domain-containing protein [Synechococcus sp.]
MARAPKSQRRSFGTGELLLPAPPAPAEPLSSCLNHLRSQWRREGSLAAIWQDWPNLAGAQLAPHCHPLSLHGGLLTVGASHPQWRQALLYSRPQLLAALRAAGHAIKDLRIQQHHHIAKIERESEAAIWARHPSRIDVHGMDSCPRCQRPSPAGEIALWGHCGFCRRSELAETTAMAPQNPSAGASVSEG